MTLEWRVPRNIMFVKAAGLVAALVLAFFSLPDPRGLLLVAVAVVVLAALTLRDLIAPIRLAASEEGLTLVTGFARRVEIPWTEVEGVRVDVRRRYGLRAEFVEIDVGETIHLFSAHDLGAPCTEVAAALRGLRH